MLYYIVLYYVLLYVAVRAGYEKMNAILKHVGHIIGRSSTTDLLHQSPKRRHCQYQAAPLQPLISVPTVTTPLLTAVLLSRVLPYR